MTEDFVNAVQTSSKGKVNVKKKCPWKIFSCGKICPLAN